MPLRHPVDADRVDDQLAPDDQIEMEPGDQNEIPVADRDRLVALERNAAGFGDATGSPVAAACWTGAAVFARSISRSARVSRSGGA